MHKNDEIYSTYIEVLNKELVPAMGCTEPIALAYCASKARSILGKLPSKIIVEVSGNIVKNAKSVIVPNTDGMKGIEAATAIGVIAGKEELILEVISGVTQNQKDELKEYIKNTPIEVKVADTTLSLDINVYLYEGDDSVKVRIANQHTNIVLIEKNGEVLFEKEIETNNTVDNINYDLLSVRGIYDFALMVDINDVKEILSRQIKFNTAISQEGLKNKYGANIGSVLLNTYGDDVKNRAKAKAAAGSDARMNGCELPVVINSGSGNQGMTVSLPIVEYAAELNSSEEQLYRALVISNLVAVHQKKKIGYLSAYCGAISAGAAAGAGIAYLRGGSFEDIANTMVNALAIASGVVCDGAKSSCAAKIAFAVEAGIFGNDMQEKGQSFAAGDGLVAGDIEDTIKNIGILGREGMRETDKEILSIMTCFD